MLALALVLCASSSFANDSTCVAEAASPSNRTVSIAVEHAQAAPQDGFGVLIRSVNSQASFVTVAHLFKGAIDDLSKYKVMLTFAPGSIYGTKVEARVTAIDTKRDLALLKATLPDSDYYDERLLPGLASAPLAYRGQKVWFVGRWGDWYTPVEPGFINDSSDGRLLIDRIDVQAGTSGAPLYAVTGLVGIIVDKLTVQSAKAVEIREVLRFLVEKGEAIPMTDPIMRAERYAHGLKYAEKFVAEKEQKSEARAAASGPDSGDSAGEFSLGEVMLTTGTDEYTSDDEVLLFTWISSGDGGGNHSEQYLTAVEIMKNGKLVPPSSPVTSHIGGRGVEFFDVGYESTICAPDLSRISLTGCLSNGTGTDCSTPARKAYLNCGGNFVDLGTMTIAGAPVALQSELQNKPSSAAFLDKFGVRLEEWSLDLDNLSSLSKTLQTQLPSYKPYPASDRVTGFKVVAVEDEDLARFYALSLGTVLLRVNDQSPDSAEHLACLVESLSNDEREENEPATAQFHVWRPAESQVSIESVPKYREAPPALQGAQFSIGWAKDREPLARAFQKALEAEGAKAYEEKPWQMLLPCTIKVRPDDDALLETIKQVAAGAGITTMDAWSASDYQEGQFSVLIGNDCR